MNMKGVIKNTLSRQESILLIILLLYCTPGKYN